MKKTLIQNLETQTEGYLVLHQILSNTKSENITSLNL